MNVYTNLLFMAFVLSSVRLPSRVSKLATSWRTSLDGEGITTVFGYNYRLEMLEINEPKYKRFVEESIVGSRDRRNGKSLRAKKGFWN